MEIGREREMTGLKSANWCLMAFLFGKPDRTGRSPGAVGLNVAPATCMHPEESMLARSLATNGFFGMSHTTLASSAVVESSGRTLCWPAVRKGAVVGYRRG